MPVAHWRPNYKAVQRMMKTPSPKSTLPRLVLSACLFALMSTTQAGVVKDHPGHWLGDLKIPNRPTLKIGVELFVRADGSAWASVASPDQGQYDIPVKSVVETGDTVELDLSMASMTLTWTDDHFKSVWKQGAEPLPLELKRVSDFPQKVRPQTPVAPLPYKETTLAIASVEGVTLGATLSIPTGKDKPNVVILVHGSGPQTRDAANEGHRSFAVLADYLARQGIAVLRYDKRGIARSTGDYENHTQPQLADDVAAVVQAMKARKQFNRIGLVGHSEGSMIAASVAARRPTSVDFMVSLAGVGLPGLDMMLLQDRIVAKDNGADPVAVEKLMVYVSNYYEIIIAQTEVELRLAALKALQNGLTPEVKALVEKYKMNEGTLSLGWAKKPFLRVLLLTDPQPDWRSVRCPVLALNGSLDHQVPIENLAGIVAALQDGGNTKVDSAVLPSLNHMFQTAKTGAEDEYAAIDETIAPTVLKRIVKFVKQRR